MACAALWVELERAYLGAVFRNRTMSQGTILGAAIALVWILMLMSKPPVV